MKTEELFNSLLKNPEQNFGSTIGSMLGAIEHIKDETNGEHWTDLKKQTLIMLNVKILEISFRLIALDFVKKETLKSEEFISKLADALTEDISILEKDDCSPDDLNFVFSILSKYVEGNNNLILERLKEEDTFRLWNIFKDK